MEDPIDTQQLRQFLEQQNVSKCFDPLFSGGVRQIGDIWNIDAEVLKNLEITPIARKKLTNVIETRTKSEAKFRKWGDKLTQHLVNPNSVLWPNENKDTALTYAARHGHYYVVKTLLGGSAGVDIPTQLDGSTPLCVAAAEGHASVIDALLEAGSDVRAFRKDQATALYMSVWKGHLAIVQRLIAAGADPDTARYVVEAAPATTRPFGSPEVSPTAFGSDQQSSNPFSAAYGSPLPATNAFGAATNAFGAATNVFGASPNTFGAASPSTTNAFGASPNAFGAASPSTTNAFGAATFGAATNAFGASTNAFGASPNAFGAASPSTTNAFGATTFGAATNAFGASTNAFGVSPNAFGAASPSTTNAFGATTFGAATNAFGSPNALGAATFGASPNAFGALTPFESAPNAGPNRSLLRFEDPTTDVLGLAILDKGTVDNAMYPRYQPTEFREKSMMSVWMVSITHMRCYSCVSFEELRAADYRLKPPQYSNRPSAFVAANESNTGPGQGNPSTPLAIALQLGHLEIAKALVCGGANVHNRIFHFHADLPSSAMAEVNLDLARREQFTIIRDPAYLELTSRNNLDVFGNEIFGAQKLFMVVSEKATATGTLRWRFRVSGNESWCVGLMPETETGIETCSSTHLHDRFVNLSQNGLSSIACYEGFLPKAEMHEAWVEVTCNCDARHVTFEVTSTTGAKHRYEQPLKHTIPVRLVITCRGNTTLKFATTTSAPAKKNTSGTSPSKPTVAQAKRCNRGRKQRRDRGSREVSEEPREKQPLEVTQVAQVKGHSVTTPLHYCAKQGYAELVQTLIEHMADVNALCEDGTAPLAIALQEGHKDVVSILVRNGAVVGQRDLIAPPSPEMSPAAGASIPMSPQPTWIASGERVPPLYFAAQNGLVKGVEALLEAGEDVNTALPNGATPLLISALENEAEVLELLLRRSADVNASRKDGVTALYVSAKKGHRAVCETLLVACADVTAAKKSTGATARQVAEQGGHAELAQLLQQAELAAARGESVATVFSRLAYPVPSSLSLDDAQPAAAAPDGNEVFSLKFRVGDRVRGPHNHLGGCWLPAEIVGIENGKYVVKWDDGVIGDTLKSEDELRAPEQPTAAAGEGAAESQPPAGGSPAWAVGDRVRCLHHTTRAYWPAVIAQTTADGRFVVRWDDGDTTDLTHGPEDLQLRTERTEGYSRRRYLPNPHRRR